MPSYNQQLRSAWTEFFLKTVTRDRDFDDYKTVPTALLMEYDAFATTIVHIRAFGDIPFPDGTEDRMWVRAFLAVRGHKEYAIDLMEHRETFDLLPVIRKALDEAFEAR